MAPPGKPGRQTAASKRRTTTGDNGAEPSNVTSEPPSKKKICDPALEIENINPTSKHRNTDKVNVSLPSQYNMQQNPMRSDTTVASGAASHRQPRTMQFEFERAPPVTSSGTSHSLGEVQPPRTNLQRDFSDAIQLPFVPTPQAEASRSGNSTLTTTTGPEHYVNWKIDQGGTTNIENDKRSVQRYVRDTLFADIKFLVEDEELEYTGEWKIFPNCIEDETY